MNYLLTINIQAKTKEIVHKVNKITNKDASSYDVVKL